MRRAMDLVEGTSAALAVLRRCATPLGFKASARADGYTQVWARDSMITSLGALCTDDPMLHRAVRASLETLRRHQAPLGVIPNNVAVGSGKPNWQAYADGGLWFVIGAAAALERSGEAAFFRRFWPAIERALRWYEYQDGDQDGLIAIQEASDWEDLLAVRGTSLTVNCLYVVALRRASVLARRWGKTAIALRYAALARQVKRRLNERLWYTPQRSLATFVQSGVVNPVRQGHDRFGRKQLVPQKKILRQDSYYLPYTTFRDFGEWFDTLGNSLAVLSGVSAPAQTDALFRFFQKHGVLKPLPAKAIVPPIRPGAKDWRYYYRFGNLNLPDQYHNGGLWPFLGGFAVAAAVAAHRFPLAARTLDGLAALNRRGLAAPWGFHEWFHGRTGRPAGMPEQAWSAGMYLYAWDAVEYRRVRFLR